MKSTPTVPTLFLNSTLQTIRLMRGIEISSAAQHLGITPRAMEKIENGDISPTIETLSALAQLYVIELTELIEQYGPIVTIQQSDEEHQRERRGSLYIGPREATQLLTLYGSQHSKPALLITLSWITTVLTIVWEDRTHLQGTALDLLLIPEPDADQWQQLHAVIEKHQFRLAGQMISDPDHWENAFPQTATHSIIANRLTSLRAFEQPAEQDNALRTFERTQHGLKLRLASLYIKKDKTRTALESELHEIEGQQTERMIELARQHLGSSVITSWQIGGAALQRLSSTNPTCEEDPE